MHQAISAVVWLKTELTFRFINVASRGAGLGIVVQPSHLLNRTQFIGRWNEQSDLLYAVKEYTASSLTTDREVFSDIPFNQLGGAFGLFRYDGKSKKGNLWFFGTTAKGAVRSANLVRRAKNRDCGVVSVAERVSDDRTQT